jgi:hypothetical protein
MGWRLLPAIGQGATAGSMIARYFGRFNEGRLLGLDFGDWFILLAGSALISLLTLLV